MEDLVVLNDDAVPNPERRERGFQQQEMPGIAPRKAEPDIAAFRHWLESQTESDSPPLV
ncbi:hypothetical protein BN2497_5579 [Janthinobacterium sp. CG23_2]|nr:hypothetical protein BN2497_5579 [Janthinobacterium sp. CG23_2]CUU29187.1 hypothetical protein BN3177_5579 [Janthinobacterium sp. CG23_2]